MKRKYLFLFILALGLFQFSPTAHAQTIKRATKCSAGASQTSTSFNIKNTVGQVVCGTVSASSMKLRQGFQQPFTNKGGRFDPLCVQVLPNIVTFDVTSKTTNCGTYFFLEYTGNETTGLKYEWNFGAGAIQEGSTVKAPSNISYASLGNKTIKLKVSAACGDTVVFKEVSKIINVSGLGFAGKATVKAVNCFGDKNGSLDMAVIGGTAPFTFKWSNNSTAKSQTNLAAGSYSYTLTDSKSCVFSDAVKISSPDTVLFLAPKNNPESCEGEKDGSIILNAQGGTAPYTYTWANNLAGNTGEINGVTAGTYAVTVTDSKGCKVSSTEVKVLEFCKDGGDGIPNVFTPNSDASNATWVIPGIDKYPNNEVSIYNRWGQTIYSKKGYNNEWRGTNTGGEELPMAAYYYLVKLNDVNDTVFSGSITIVR